MLMAALVGGRYVAASPTLAPMFTADGLTIGWAIIAYGFVASVIPVWMLLCPRDYLSTFLKVGTILALALGIFLTLPEIRLPALTRFTDGSGPIFAGSLFRSASSPSPAARSPASTRWLPAGPRRRWSTARATRG